MPSGRFASDMTGQKFFHLTVIRRCENFISKSGNSFAQWVCKCECGNQIKAKGADLRRGYRKKCSPQCPKFGHRIGDAAFNNVYRDMKRGAIRRNIIWNLSKIQVKEITSKDCYYCGISPIQSSRRMDLNGDYLHNGIDRVDNSKGYTVSNCVPCCKKCNISKSTMKSEEFRVWIIDVYEHWASH